MAGVGGALFSGNSKLFSGPLGVVKIGFKGYDLGKTIADSNLSPDQDIKDIIYQQDGTKPADHVRTGIEFILSCTLGEISTGLLVALMGGVTSQNAIVTEDSGLLGRSIYQSMLDNEADVLKVVAVDENGVASEEVEDRILFYSAIPIVDGELINWGADTQRNFPVQFRIKFHVFADGESTTQVGAFGYWGDPVVEDVPVAVWPDVEAPSIVTADASAAVTLDVTFDENIAFQTAFDATHFMAKVNGVFVAPTAGVITLTAIALTFPAATFAASDEIELSISELALEDTETIANTYPGVDGQICTDSI